MKQIHKLHKAQQEKQMVIAAIITGIILLLAFLAPKISAQTVPDAKCAIRKSMAFTSTEYGFTLRVPKTWKSNYQVCETKKPSANVSDFEFFVRKNKKSDFKSVILIHVYEKDRMDAEGVTFAGRTVSERGNLAVTAEETAVDDPSLAKYAKEAPNILKGVRWVNFAQFRKVIEGL